MDGYSPKTMRKSSGFNAPNRRIMLSRLYRTFLALISRPRCGRWCPNRTGRIDPHSLPCSSTARVPACSQYWARAAQSYDRTRMRVRQTARESIQHYQGDLNSGCDIIWLFQTLTCWATVARVSAATVPFQCMQHLWAEMTRLSVVACGDGANVHSKSSTSTAYRLQWGANIKILLLGLEKEMFKKMYAIINI